MRLVRCLRRRHRAPCGHAFLREDYLNQVQRDFLSRGWPYSTARNTPSGTPIAGGVRIVMSLPHTLHLAPC